MGATGLQRAYLFLNSFNLLSHVVGSGLDPHGVVDDPVYGRVAMDAGLKPLVPAALRLLHAQHRAGRAVATFQGLEWPADQLPGGVLQQPLIDGLND